jgi:hypothetical protein
MDNRKHHHERTGQFLSSAAIKGFAVRPHPPVVAPLAPEAPQAPTQAPQAPQPATNGRR